MTAKGESCLAAGRVAKLYGRRTTCRMNLSVLTVTLLAAFSLASHASEAAPASTRTQPAAAELFKLLSPSVFVIETLDEKGVPIALGSGVSTTKDGIVTNRHVVEGGYHPSLFFVVPVGVMTTIGVFGYTHRHVEVRETSFSVKFSHSLSNAAILEAGTISAVAIATYCPGSVPRSSMWTLNAATYSSRQCGRLPSRKLHSCTIAPAA